MDKFFDKLNENKFFIGCMMIMVTIGGRFIITELSETQKNLILHPIVKKIFICLINYTLCDTIVISKVNK